MKTEVIPKIIKITEAVLEVKKSIVKVPVEEKLILIGISGRRLSSNDTQYTRFKVIDSKMRNHSSNQAKKQECGNSVQGELISVNDS